MGDPTLQRALRTNAAQVASVASYARSPQQVAQLRDLMTERDGLVRKALATRDVLALQSCSQKELRAIGTANERSRMDLGASGAMAAVVRLRGGR